MGGKTQPTRNSSVVEQWIVANYYAKQNSTSRLFNSGLRDNVFTLSFQKVYHGLVAQ